MSDASESSFDYNSDLLSISSIDTNYDLSSCDDLSSADGSESEYPEEAADDVEVPWVKEGIPRPNFPFTSDPARIIFWRYLSYSWISI
ncbi:unnamed protein product [Acanthoscelides obtectus]|uniref:Uncharacterized protein n=1 Tax=Acanthoscelides obtectus TaxID=200917 RepID=A0A9P0LCU8_ACAOB|nr:unnamed protein product [Acanthoscelides obtectus]CAK1638404.1 hypothetical protein AOBTE_LOCUS10587 [Acanthoscelides obtectus]